MITTDPTLVLADSPDIPMTSAGDKDPTVDVADSLMSYIDGGTF